MRSVGTLGLGNGPEKETDSLQQWFRSRGSQLVGYGPYGAKTHMGHRVVMIQNELGTTVWE